MLASQRRLLQQSEGLMLFIQSLQFRTNGHCGQGIWKKKSFPLAGKIKKHFIMFQVFEKNGNIVQFLHVLWISENLELELSHTVHLDGASFHQDPNW